MNVLIIGAERGIGAALARVITEPTEVTLIKTSRKWNKLEQESDHVWRLRCDITDTNSINNMNSELSNQFEHIDWLINCAGVLHTADFMPEKTIRSINTNQLLENYQTNAIGHLEVIKTLEKLLTKSEHTLIASLSARIGSIEDNHLGGWFAYRMSKAALNMGMKTLAIEWVRKNPQVKFILLHPGTTDTDLSTPFQKNLPKGQLQTADETATYLFQQLTKHQNHNDKFPLFIDYKGQPIPW